MDQTHCTYCGKSIAGRTDKKFCSEKCRNAWHYEQNKGSRLIQKRIITDLCSNHRILSSLLKERKYSADIFALTDLGFKPEYITGIRDFRNGRREFRVFDISYSLNYRKVFNIHKD